MKEWMICKHCLRPFPLLAIHGVRYRAVKKTRIPQRHIDVSAQEALLILPIPLLVVKRNGSKQRSGVRGSLTTSAPGLFESDMTLLSDGATPPKEPTTEPETG